VLRVHRGERGVRRLVRSDAPTSPKRRLLPAPQPRHLTRIFGSSTLAAGRSPSLSKAAGVSAMTWWQAGRSTFAKPPCRP
jgi:hypothetical protein